MELNRCLGSNELFKFLNDPLPSWLKYFDLSKEEYLTEIQDVEEARIKRRTNVGQVNAAIRTNSQLFEQDLSLSHASLQVPLQPTVSSSPLF